MQCCLSICLRYKQSIVVLAVGLIFRRKGCNLNSSSKGCLKLVTPVLFPKIFYREISSTGFVCPQMYCSLFKKTIVRFK